jgi:hypothetical protein
MGHVKLASGQADRTGDERGSPEKGWKIELMYICRAEDRYAKSHECRSDDGRIGESNHMETEGRGLGSEFCFMLQ